MDIIKNYSKRIIKSPLLSGTLIMIIGSNFNNALSYLFHIILGRMLDPSGYGELSAILSLVGLISVAFTFSSIVIVKFLAQVKAKEMNDIFCWFMSAAQKILVIMSVALLIILPLFSIFLRINVFILYLIIPILGLNLINLVRRSFLQSQLRFMEFVIAITISGVMKVVFAVLLVYLGFQVLGATLGLLLSTAVGFITLKYFTREYNTKAKVKKLNIKKDVLLYAYPVAISSFSTLAFISNDMLMVKHYFLPVEAGQYAAIVTVGKILFYAAAPVTGVMFPIITKRKSENKEYMSMLWLSLLFVIGISAGVLILFKLWPVFLLSSIFGNKYSSVAGNLFIYGLFLALLTLSSVVVNFFLAIEKVKVVYYMLTAAILQFVGILFFHSSIRQIIYVNLFSAGILCIFLVKFLFNETQREYT